MYKNQILRNTEGLMRHQAGSKVVDFAKLVVYVEKLSNYKPVDGKDWHSEEHRRRI